MARPEPSFAAPPTLSTESPSVPVRNCSRLTWALAVLPLAWLWFRLIYNLWPEWNTNPQYSYGLVVPLLAIGLLMRRWHAVRSTEIGDRRSEVGEEKQTAEDERGKAESRKQNSDGGNQFQHSVFSISAFLLAFLYLPTRLVEAATPEWRPLEWLLAVEVIGLTLYAVYLAGGKSWLRRVAFPVIFFLVAIPWPTPIEQPVIQGLSRMNAALVVEMMGILGVPALQHGNLIEVSTGMVGINDACSGIRSFQSSLMISLFLGEFYRFTWRRRLMLLPIGFALAMCSNLCRTSLLTWIAAKKGIAAIAVYHDEAGLTIVLVCTLGLWALAAWLARRETRETRQKSEVRSQGLDGSQELEGSVGKVERNQLDSSPCIPLPARGGDEDRGQKPAVVTASSKLSTLNLQLSTNTLSSFSLALMVWLVVVETGVGLWYHFRELSQKPGLNWTVNFPVDNPTFKELPLTTEAHELLRFDQGKNGQWREPDGTIWQSFYFNWQPGQVAGYLAKRHTPEICLTASGLKMTAGPRLEIMNVQGVELPMRFYTFDSSGGPLQVFQCRWEAGAGKESYLAEDLTRFNLIRGVWAGRGNQGQKVLEVIISGIDNPEQAKQALARQLEKLIKVESLQLK